VSDADTSLDGRSAMPIIRRSNLILPRLPPQVTAKLLACAFKRAVKAGEALFVAGERGDGCYRIEQGLVKIIVASARGEQRIIALVGGGEIVGELALIDHQPRSASAIAIHDSTLQYVSRQSFADCAKDYAEIYRYLTAILAGWLRETDEALEAAGFLSVRLAEYVGKDVGEGRVMRDQRFSRSDLAAMAGVARENVSRVLSDLKKRRLVTRCWNSYTLNDIGAPEREAHH
jgi:CRP/FNR family transcriptional regulator, cyclic AMP receptor protein